MQFEIPIINFIGNLRNPTLDSFLIFFTQLGSERVIFILAILATILFLYFRKYYQWALFLFIFLGGEIIVNSVKYLAGRTRPEVLAYLVEQNGFSFPSGHSFVAFIFYGLSAYFLTKNLKNKKAKILIWILASSLVFLVGFSRIYLGVHWPTDVLGAFLIAFSWMFLVIFIFRKKASID